MTELLLKSNRLMYENTDITIDELAIQADMLTEDYIVMSENLGSPAYDWKKVPSYLPSPIDNNMEIVHPHLDEELLRRDIDTAYRTIVTEVNAQLMSIHDIEPKDLKDLVSVLDSVERNKFPKTAKVVGEIDLTSQLVKFIAEVPNDI